MKLSHFAFGAAIVLLFVSLYSTSYQLIDSYEAEWGLKARTLRGVMRAEMFPVRRFGQAPAIDDSRQYMELDVLALQDNNSTIFLEIGGRTEMLLAKGSGNSRVGGTLMDEINDAYRLGLEVEISGNSYTKKREGVTYDLMKVSDFTIIEHEKIPLVIYESRREVNDESSILYRNDRVEGERTFHVGRDRKGSFWKQVSHEYQLFMRDLDVLNLEFNASRPVSIHIYAPEGTFPISNQSIHGDLVFYWENTKQMDQNFQCHDLGKYTVIIEGDSNMLSEVSLNLSKQPLETDEVFFKESGGTSCMTGGMGLVGIYPSLPPDTVHIGVSRDNMGYWCEFTRNYSTRLNDGDMIRYQYNATSPVKLLIKGPNNTIFHDDYWIEDSLKINHTGNYVFKFSSEFDAMLSFKAHHLDEKRRIGNNSNPFVSFRGQTTRRMPSWIPRFTSQKLQGHLGVTSFPLMTDNIFDIVETGEHQVLDLQDKENFILHFSGRLECVPYPEGSSTLIDVTSMHDLVNCYENNLSITTWGFPFELVRNGTKYQMFHVSGLSVDDVENLPIHVKHSLNVVGGRTHHCGVDDSFETLPFLFTTGYDTIQTSGGAFTGNQEHFFKVYLVDGERISYNVNSSGLMQVILYKGHGIRNFIDKHDKYILNEVKVSSVTGILDVSETDAYYFGVRGYSGSIGDASIKIERIG